MQMLFWNVYYSSVSVIIIYTMLLCGCSNQTKGSYWDPFFLFSAGYKGSFIAGSQRMISKTKQSSIISLL